MVLAGGNENIVRGYFIQEAVLAGNTPRPITRQVPFKRLRLAFTMKRVSLYSGDEVVYFGEDFFVLCRPFLIFLESRLTETYHAPAPVPL